MRKCMLVVALFVLQTGCYAGGYRRGGYYGGGPGYAGGYYGMAGCGLGDAYQNAACYVR